MDLYNELFLKKRKRTRNRRPKISEPHCFLKVLEDKLYLAGDRDREDRRIKAQIKINRSNYIKRTNFI